MKTTVATPIEKGQIRKPTKKSNQLQKVISPDDSEMIMADGTSQKVKLYISTMDITHYHRFVIKDIVESARIKGIIFCVVYILTHNEGFNNIRVTSDLYDATATDMDLTESYISQDEFLVAIKDIHPAKSYGQFYLNNLKEALDF